MVDEEEVETEETVAEEVEEQVEETTTEEEAEVVEEVEETEEVEEPVKKEVAPLPKGVQKRIDKITRQKYDAERQIQALQQQLDQRPEAKPTNTEKPTLEQFEFDDAKYIEALTDWKVNERFQAEQSKNADTQRQTQQSKVVAAFEEKVGTTVDKGVAAYDDFEEVAIDNPEVFVTPQMANVISDSEIGHDIAYYLGSNPQESVRIAQLAPIKQVEEIVRLEIKLTAKPAKKVSKATAPIKPVGAKGSTTTKIDPKKDLRKWMEARNKEEFG